MLPFWISPDDSHSFMQSEATRLASLRWMLMLRSKTPTKVFIDGNISVVSHVLINMQLYRLIEEIAPVLLKTLAEATQSTAVCTITRGIFTVLFSSIEALTRCMLPSTHTHTHTHTHTQVCCTDRFYFRSYSLRWRLLRRFAPAAKQSSRSRRRKQMPSLRNSCWTSSLCSRL